MTCSSACLHELFPISFGKNTFDAVIRVLTTTIHPHSPEAFQIPSSLVGRPPPHGQDSSLDYLNEKVCSRSPALLASSGALDSQQCDSPNLWLLPQLLNFPKRWQQHFGNKKIFSRVFKTAKKFIFIKALIFSQRLNLSRATSMDNEYCFTFQQLKSTGDHRGQTLRRLLLLIVINLNDIVPLCNYYILYNAG